MTTQQLFLPDRAVINATSGQLQVAASRWPFQVGDTLYGMEVTEVLRGSIPDFLCQPVHGDVVSVKSDDRIWRDRERMWRRMAPPTVAMTAHNINQHRLWVTGLNGVTQTVLRGIYCYLYLQHDNIQATEHYRPIARAVARRESFLPLAPFGPEEPPEQMMSMVHGVGPDNQHFQEEAIEKPQMHLEQTQVYETRRMRQQVFGCMSYEQVASAVLHGDIGTHAISNQPMFLQYQGSVIHRIYPASEGGLAFVFGVTEIDHENLIRNGEHGSRRVLLPTVYDEETYQPRSQIPDDPVPVSVTPKEPAYTKHRRTGNPDVIDLHPASRLRPRRRFNVDRD